MERTLEEFAHILLIPIKDQVPYTSLDVLSECALIAQDLHLKKEVVESNIRTKDNTRGFLSKIMMDKATIFADSGSWDALYAIFALPIYRLVLFLNVKGFIDKVVVNIFLSINIVPTHLADVYYSFHWRNKKKDGMINYCIHLLYKWISAHLPRKGPFVDNVGALKWSQR